MSPDLLRLIEEAKRASEPKGSALDAPSKGDELIELEAALEEYRAAQKRKETEEFWREHSRRMNTLADTVKERPPAPREDTNAAAFRAVLTPVDSKKTFPPNVWQSSVPLEAGPTETEAASKPKEKTLLQKAGGLARNVGGSVAEGASSSLYGGAEGLARMTANTIDPDLLEQRIGRHIENLAAGPNEYARMTPEQLAAVRSKYEQIVSALPVRAFRAWGEDLNSPEAMALRDAKTPKEREAALRKYKERFPEPEQTTEERENAINELRRIFEAEQWLAKQPRKGSVADLVAQGATKGLVEAAKGEIHKWRLAPPPNEYAHMTHGQRAAARNAYQKQMDDPAAARLPGSSFGAPGRSGQPGGEEARQLQIDYEKRAAAKELAKIDAADKWVAARESGNPEHNILDKGLKGAANLFRSAAENYQWTRQDIRNALPVDQEFQNSYAGGILQGVGQMAADLPTYTVPGLGPALAVGGAYDEGYYDALEKTGDEETAHDAGMKSAPSAALDYLGDKLILGKVLKPLKGKITVGELSKRFAANFASEGGTEGAQRVWGNLVANTLAGYDPERKLDDDVIKSIIVGGIVGGASSAVGTTLGHGLERAERYRKLNAVRSASNESSAKRSVALADDRSPVALELKPQIAPDELWLRAINQVRDYERNHTPSIRDADGKEVPNPNYVEPDPEAAARYAKIKDLLENNDISGLAALAGVELASPVAQSESGQSERSGGEEQAAPSVPADPSEIKPQQPVETAPPSPPPTKATLPQLLNSAAAFLEHSESELASGAYKQNKPDWESSPIDLSRIADRRQQYYEQVHDFYENDDFDGLARLFNVDLVDETDVLGRAKEETKVNADNRKSHPNWRATIPEFLGKVKELLDTFDEAAQYKTTQEQQSQSRAPSGPGPILSWSERQYAQELYDSDQFQKLATLLGVKLIDESSIPPSQTEGKQDGESLVTPPQPNWSAVEPTNNENQSQVSIEVSADLESSANSKKTLEVAPGFTQRDTDRRIIVNDEYIKNPSAVPLLSLVQPTGHIVRTRFNEIRPFVLTIEGEIVVGRRGATRDPKFAGYAHPNLIGGRSPVVLAAGMIRIQDGKIRYISNQSGHFRPDWETFEGRMSEVIKKLPKELFHPKFLFLNHENPYLQ